MAFIAINARSDITSEISGNPTSTLKKGKITPAQMAQVNAWSLSRKTGIFDFAGKCEAKNLEPDINNNSSTIVFNKGYISVYGRIVECEQDTSFTLTGITSGSTGKIVLRFDLASLQERECQILAITREPVKVDLNENNLMGVYELVLYDYEVTSTKLKLTRNIEYIKDMEQVLKDISEGRFIVERSRYAESAPHKEEITGEETASNNGLTFSFSNTNGFGTSDPERFGYWKLWNLIEQDGKIQCALVPSKNNHQTIGNGVKGLNDLYICRNGASQSLNSILDSLGFKTGNVTGWSNSGITLEKLGKFAILRLPMGDPKKLPKKYTELKMYVDGNPLVSNETLNFALVGTETQATISLTEGSNIAIIYSGGGDMFSNWVRSFSIGFKIQ